MKRIILFSFLLSVMVAGCHSSQDSINYCPDDTPKEWRYVSVDMQDCLYEISVEFITEREFSRLNKKSYEYEYVELDSTSDECQRVRALAIKGAPSSEMKSRLDGSNTEDEWRQFIGIRKYPQSSQCELLFDRPNGEVSVMMTGNVVDSNYLYCDLHSYSMDGVYACQKWTDCDFCCGVTFLRFNPETNSMEAVGRYVDSRFAFEEWGDYEESSIRWIAPGKLLCKGYKNPYETCWGWTPNEEDMIDIESHLNQPVYLIINLKKK